MLMQNPLVSIVIPMYNVETYIRTTIESILQQTYKNIEIVVIDDGSTDKSAEIIRSLQVKHNIKYIFQNNSGVSTARNLGIENSTGDYIAFLDSDDIWLETKLEKQIEKLQKTGLEVCYCGYQEFIDINSPYGKMPKTFYEGNILLQFLYDKAICWTSTWLIKKEIISKNHLYFTPGCSMAEDLEFFSKILFTNPVCAVKEHLALYRKRSDSLTYSPNRVRENEAWERFITWFSSQPNLLNYDLEKVLESVNNYRIAGNSIYCIFDKMFTKNLSLTEVRSDSQFKHIFHYKSIATLYSFKLLIKKNIIQDEILFKFFTTLYKYLKKMKLQEENH